MPSTRAGGPSAASYSVAMTQMTMGGAGANEVSEVLEEASCRRSGAWRTKKRGRPFLVDPSLKLSFRGAWCDEIQNP